MVPAAQAVEALIQQYGRLVFHTIYGLTGDWEESQDLTQDTFQQALKSIEAARTSSGPHFNARAWLLKIALNTVRMQERRKRLFRFVPFSSLGRQQRRDQEPEGEHLTEDLAAQAVPVQPQGYGAISGTDPGELIAERDAVQRTLQRLPEPLRVCLLLSVVGDFSSAEIAQMLDVSEPAVRQRLVRARRQFQQLYALERGDGPRQQSGLVPAPACQAGSSAGASPLPPAEDPEEVAAHQPEQMFQKGDAASRERPERLVSGPPWHDGRPYAAFGFC
ncbi:RNA polymerase sigma factor [Thermogemmatispora sp.]|uniref:RNA polymerase sigma factor n=1 Tax=Thermogemmatispora sp. TaxID=1968838 RepID=UPI001D2CB6B2|nr:RNA polymerase sigma factor [Thermogemmatispora sp.]MBX5449756.1 RNA polymerase sigma factor [Thermogemmatispora sp.]